MRTDFSIIIPIYNCSKYIKRCIDSILNQKHQNYEIILIDDGSTDDSNVICNYYKEKYEFIHVIQQKNRGVSAARNIGLNNAIGKYIIFLDIDDYLETGYLIDSVKIINENPKMELFIFGFFSEVENSSLKKISIDKISYKNKIYYSRDEIKKDFIELWDNSMLYNIWNKIYLRKVIVDNNILFPEKYWGEDVEFNKLYLNKISSLYLSEKCYYHYIREREGATTTIYKPDFFDIRRREFIEFNQYFKSWNISQEEYYEFSCRRYIERLFGCIENTYCFRVNILKRYKIIKNMINDKVTREALKFVQPQSKKIYIMLIPIRFNSTIFTMIMGRIFHFIKVNFPALFNQLKNRR